MKNKVYKITTFILAILVLVSTFSFTVEKHFCGDFLVDISFIGHAEGCDMKEGSYSMKDCCKDEVQQIKGQDKLQKVNYDLELFTKNYVSNTTNFYVKKSITLSTKKTVSFKEYSPPKLIINKQILHEVFII